MPSTSGVQEPGLPTRRFLAANTRRTRKALMTDKTVWKDLRALLDKPYVVLDTETTGLLDPEIVSIAILSHSGETIVNRFVRPTKPIDPEATKVSGIDASTVADAPPFSAIESAVSSALTGKLVVIYNADFDTAALRNTYARYGLTLPSFETWCAMKWFARVYGDWNERRRDYAWKPLAQAAEYFGVPQAAAHDALDDTLTTWRILQAATQRAGESIPGMRPLFDELGTG